MFPNNLLRSSYGFVAEKYIYHSSCCLIETLKYYMYRSYDSYLYPTFLYFFCFISEYGSILFYKLCFQISDHSLTSTFSLTF